MRCNKIYIDCDGVLTDGKIWYNQTGERTKGFHTRDIRAIKELVSHGLQVYIITASTWPGINDFAERCGAEVVMERDKEKLLNGEPFIAIGDDVWDKAILERAAKAFCPVDADEEIKALPGITILNTPGGSGAISELVRLLSFQ